MNKKTILLVIAIFIVICVAQLFYHLVTSMDFLGRKPNAHEWFYEEAAVDTGEQSICEKIGKKSYYVVPGIFPWGGRQDTKAFLERSYCFYEIALNTKNPVLCDQVVPIHTFFYDGSGWTPENCRQDITTEHGNSNATGTHIPANDFKQIFQEMGYTQDVIIKENSDAYKRSISYREGNSDPGIIHFLYWNFYLNNRNTPDFLQHVKNLPSFD